MKKNIAAIIISLFLTATASAATIKLEVDTLGQQYDSIRIHMANIPRDFVYSDPPAYAGTGDPVAGSANLKHITISGLTPGQTYKFIAVLTRGSNHSPGSNIVQEKMPVVVIELTAPGLRAVETRGE